MPRLGFYGWLTGLPSAGKTSIARSLIPLLEEQGMDVEVLDGGGMRQGPRSELGFDRTSWEARARQITFVARLLARHGVVIVVALVSPYAASRWLAWEQIGIFVKVHVAMPWSACGGRDGQGFHRKARQGILHERTEVDGPYEPPERPDIRLDTLGQTVGKSARVVPEGLGAGRGLPPTPPVVDLLPAGEHRCH